MDVRLYFNGSWEYLLDRNGTCVTYVIRMLSFLVFKDKHNVLICI